MSLLYDFICGSMAGISQILVGHPFDTLKVLKQNHKTISTLNLKTLYRGAMYPLPQSIICNGLVFPINNNLKQYIDNPLLTGFISGVIVTPVVFFFDIGKTKSQLQLKFNINNYIKTRGLLSTLYRESLAFSIYFYTYEKCRDYNLNIMMSGAMSGITNWTLTYPLDVIRNRQIAYNISMKEAFNQGSLWGGYRLCIIRAIFTNASVFYTYETCKTLLYNI